MSARITVRVTPRSGRECIEPGAGGVFVVKVTVAPEDGKANAAVCRLLAGALGVPKSAVRVVRGTTARIKTLEIDGVTEADVAKMRCDR
jgi:uncharacterized protein